MNTSEPKYFLVHSKILLLGVIELAFKIWFDRMKTEDAVSSNYYNRSIEHIPKKDSSVDTKAVEDKNKV